MSVRTVIVILLIYLLSSCTDEQGTILRQADAIMESRPDSAMTLLEGIDRTRLTQSDLAYFALLYTQAQVKNDIPLDSDSLIRIAYTRYHDDSNGDRGLRSNFYMGEVFFNRKKNPQAMHYYLTVYEESKRLGNDYWRAKAAERISDLFFLAYNYNEAEKYMREATNLFKKLDRTVFHRYTLAALSNILLNKQEAETAFTLLDSLKTITLNENPIDSIFLNYISEPLTAAITKTRRLTGKESELSYLQQTEILDEYDIDTAILKEKVYERLDKPEEVTNDLYEALTVATTGEDKVHVLYALFRNAKAIGNRDKALSLVDSLLFYQNKVAEDVILESVTKAQSDFYADREIIQKGKSDFFRNLLIFSCAFFLMLLALIISLIHFRNKAHKAELKADMEMLGAIRAFSENKIREKEMLEKTVRYKDSVINDLAERIDESSKMMESLNTRIAESNSTVDILKNELEIRKTEFDGIRDALNKRDREIDNMQQKLDEKSNKEIAQAQIVEKLFKEKWTTLDMLCDRYFSLDNSELSEKETIASIRKELKRIVSRKGVEDIMAAVETHLGGILSALRSQCPFLKEDDVCFLALSYAGFSPRSICLFTGIKYKHHYVKKARLIERIKKSEAPDKDLFLSKLK